MVGGCGSSCFAGPFIRCVLFGAGFSLNACVFDVKFLIGLELGLPFNCLSEDPELTAVVLKCDLRVSMAVKLC